MGNSSTWAAVAAVAGLGQCVRQLGADDLCLGTGLYRIDLTERAQLEPRRRQQDITFIRFIWKLQHH